MAESLIWPAASGENDTTLPGTLIGDGDREPQPSEAMMATPNAEQQSQANEGEGSRTADRNYREGVRKHIATNDVEREAREAAEALDNEAEAKELKKAENLGRTGPRKQSE